MVNLTGAVDAELRRIRTTSIEQDHRFTKKRIAASLGFRSADGAWRTIEGYEAMPAMRKGQVSWVAKGDAVARPRFPLFATEPRAAVIH